MTTVCFLVAGGGPVAVWPCDCAGAPARRGGEAETHLPVARAMLHLVSPPPPPPSTAASLPSPRAGGITSLHATLPTVALTVVAARGLAVGCIAAHDDVLLHKAGCIAYAPHHETAAWAAWLLVRALATGAALPAAVASAEAAANAAVAAATVHDIVAHASGTPGEEPAPSAAASHRSNVVGGVAATADAAAASLRASVATMLPPTALPYRFAACGQLPASLLPAAAAPWAAASGGGGDGGAPTLLFDAFVSISRGGGGGGSGGADDTLLLRRRAWHAAAGSGGTGRAVGGGVYFARVAGTAAATSRCTHYPPGLLASLVAPQRAAAATAGALVWLPSHDSTTGDLPVTAERVYAHRHEVTVAAAATPLVAVTVALCGCAAGVVGGNSAALTAAAEGYAALTLRALGVREDGTAAAPLPVEPLPPVVQHVAVPTTSHHAPHLRPLVIPPLLSGGGDTTSASAAAPAAAAAAAPEEDHTIGLTQLTPNVSPKGGYPVSPLAPPVVPATSGGGGGGSGGDDGGAAAVGVPVEAAAAAAHPTVDDNGELVLTSRSDVSGVSSVSSSVLGYPGASPPTASAKLVGSTSPAMPARHPAPPAERRGSRGGGMARGPPVRSNRRLVPAAAAGGGGMAGGAVAAPAAPVPDGGTADGTAAVAAAAGTTAAAGDPSSLLRLPASSRSLVTLDSFVSMSSHGGSFSSPVGSGGGGGGGSGAVRLGLTSLRAPRLAIPLLATEAGAGGGDGALAASPLPMDDSDLYCVSSEEEGGSGSARGTAAEASGEVNTARSSFRGDDASPPAAIPRHLHLLIAASSLPPPPPPSSEPTLPPPRQQLPLNAVVAAN